MSQLNMSDEAAATPATKQTNNPGWGLNDDTLLVLVMTKCVVTTIDGKENISHTDMASNPIAIDKIPGRTPTIEMVATLIPADKASGKSTQLTLPARAVAIDMGGLGKAIYALTDIVLPSGELITMADY